MGERSRLMFALAVDDVSALDSQFDFLEGSQWRLGDRCCRASKAFAPPSTSSTTIA